MEWFKPTLTLLPFAAWMFLGAGLPWALALLPRDLWREKLVVVAVGMALGPLSVTLVMFALGTASRITLGGTLLGSALVTITGIGLAWRRRKEPVPAVEERPQTPVGRYGRLLIMGMLLVLAVHVVTAAYWPFLAYDPLWVFAYNGKLFTMQQHIPSRIGYYPQLMALSYTYMQQSWGGVSDHAARVVLPWYNVTMSLMAYTLGRIVFRSRRVGLLTAATWSFYPHVTAWAGAGDLEMPLALYMTGAAAFFVEAWRSERTHLAILSGILLGGALWTKPTAGALALGVLLAAAVGGAGVRFRWKLWWPKLRIALITGIASVPIGGVWYLRNLLLGHTVVVFPAGYWHSFAQRSGQELGWPVLIAGCVALGLLAYPSERLRAMRRRTRIGLPLLALALLLAGTLPSALKPDALHQGSLFWNWVRGDLGASRPMHLLDWLLVIAGLGLLAWLSRDYWLRWNRDRWTTLGLLWALLLPYAVVWFLDFSYHYRLSFAIVPLVGVQFAALIDGWAWDWFASARLRQGLAASLTAGIVAVAVAAGVQHSAKVWLKGGLPDDTAKYDSGNPALMTVVHMLERYAQENGKPPVVMIPGEDRLPFFFPTWDIRNSRERKDLPTRLEDLKGVDIFINSSVMLFLEQRAGLFPNSLLARADAAADYARYGVLDQAWPVVLDPIPLAKDGSLPIDDGNFRYMAYTVHLDQRYVPMQPNGPAEGRVVIGGFAEYLGYGMINLNWARGETIRLWLYWRPTDEAPPPQDYSIYLHLLDADGNMVARWDNQPLMGHYSTHYWQPGESLLDYWVLRIPKDAKRGPVSLRIGIYDPIGGQRLSVVTDGAVTGDGLTIETRIVIK